MLRSLVHKCKIDFETLVTLCEESGLHLGKFRTSDESDPLKAILWPAWPVLIIHLSSQKPVGRAKLEFLSWTEKLEPVSRGILRRSDTRS